MEKVTTSVAASVAAIDATSNVVAPVVSAARGSTSTVTTDVTNAIGTTTMTTTTTAIQVMNNDITTANDATSVATSTIKATESPAATANATTVATSAASAPLTKIKPSKYFTTKLAASTPFLTTKALNNLNITTTATSSTTAARRRADDPFSTLPDTALIHIIQRLPFEDAARTPAISRPFGFVWPCSRKVVLDESGFTVDATRRALENQGRRSLAQGIRNTGRTAFVNYARRYIARYNENKVDEFVLRFSLPGQYRDDVQAWIDIAAQRSAESIEIDFSDHDFDNKYPEGYAGAVQLPPNLYSASLRKSLQTLKLSGCLVVPAGLGTFEVLRKLHLARTELTRATECLVIQQCPQLEDLTLVKVNNLDGILVTGGRNSHLLRLTLDDCQTMGDGVEINSTMLSYFKYRGAFVDFRLEMPGLEEAELDFYTEDEYHGWGDLLVHILYELRAAKVLTLCSYCLQILPSMTLGPIQQQGGFAVGNLSHLILNKVSLHRDELPGISVLLQTYKKLESVTFKLGPRRELINYEHHYPLAYDGYYFWTTQFGLVPCFANHLRTVRMENFRGKENEVALLRFVLEGAQVLQEVLVNVAKDTPEEIEAYMAVGLGLHQFKRASHGVRITVT